MSSSVAPRLTAKQRAISRMHEKTLDPIGIARFRRPIAHAAAPKRRRDECFVELGRADQSALTAAISAGGRPRARGQRTSRPPGRRAPRRPRGSTEILGPSAAAQRGQDGPRLKGEVPRWNRPGEAAIYRSSSVLSWLSRNRASVGDYPSPRKLDGVAGMPLVRASCPGHLV
jgi:hypothetical protein